MQLLFTTYNIEFRKLLTTMFCAYSKRDQIKKVVSARFFLVKTLKISFQRNIWHVSKNYVIGRVEE